VALAAAASVMRICALHHPRAASHFSQDAAPLKLARERRTGGREFTLTRPLPAGEEGNAVTAVYGRLPVRPGIHAGLGGDATRFLLFLRSRQPRSRGFVIDGLSHRSAIVIEVDALQSIVNGVAGVMFFLVLNVG
jgi:hypothetical protein